MHLGQHEVPKLSVQDHHGPIINPSNRHHLEIESRESLATALISASCQNTRERILTIGIINVSGAKW
jgi:hypothetical protein